MTGVTDGLGNLTDNANVALSQFFSPITTILKAVGIAFVVYVIYLIVKSILNWRNRNRIKNIEKKVDEINKKLDSLVGKKINKTEKKEDKKEKKKRKK